MVSFNAAGNGSSSLQLYSDPEADVPETAGGFLLNQMWIELPFHDRYPALPGAEADYRGRLSGLQLQNFIDMIQLCEHDTIFSSANNSSRIRINNLFAKLQDFKYSIARVRLQ